MTTSIQQFAHINIFAPKPGMLEQFITTWLQGVSSLGDIPGSRGSRLYRANDDRNAILISFFDSEAAHRRFRETPAFHQLRQRLLPLLEGTAPGYYSLIHSQDRAFEQGQPAANSAAS